MEALEVFTHETVYETYQGAVKELSIESKEMILLLRAALTGKVVGPSLFHIIEILGKEGVLGRIEAAL